MIPTQPRSRFDVPPSPPVRHMPAGSSRPLVEPPLDPPPAFHRMRAEKSRRGAGLAGRLLWAGLGLTAGLLAGVVGGVLLVESRAQPTPVTAEAQTDAVPGTLPAEQARLAELRDARARLESELAVLQQEAEQRRRSMPGRKTDPDATTGSDALPARAAGPAAPQVAASASARVFIHHRAGSAPAGQAAEATAQTIRGAGFEIGGIRQTPFVPATRVVRYFHEEDAAAAARLASRLGAGWAIQDFRAFQPQPAPQTLEVWLPGN